ncbi:MAG: cellulose-binding protein [Saccharothrix sp.]|nr:cellulose-binding protein [Saccharothrix sp.]
MFGETRKRSTTTGLLPALVAAVVAALSFVVAPISAAQPSAAAPVRIMPLGDSITAGPGCWRAYLWDRLQKTGYTDVDFVGTQPGGGCSVPFDGDHEGHGGFAATGIADQNQLPPWLAATHPDIVLMHLGTNDMWGNFRPIESVIAAYSKLVDQMRADNPDMKILVAKIIPMACPECTHVVALNNAIPAWAAAKTTARSPITVVDQWTGFDTATDTGDGVHPNDAGLRKMADRWYPALAAALNGSPGTTTTTTSTTTTTTTTTTTPPTGSCTATYRVVSQWNGGFQAEISVRNGTTAATSAWTAAFDFGAGRTVTQAWNATVTQTGTSVTARNLSWNGALAPGGTTTFGFLANGSGAGTPTVTCALT